MHLAPVGIVISSNGLLAAQRGVVDQDVEAAELLRPRRRPSLAAVAVGDVADDGDGACRRRLRSRRTTAVGLGLVGARVDDHRRAALRERQRDGAADIAAGAGDDGDAAVEFLSRSCVIPARLSDRCGRHRASPAAKCRAARASSQPPWRALSTNFSSISARVSGSCAPPRKCGWRSSTTAPSLQHGADMAGEVVRIRIVRIDHVTDLAASAQHVPDRAPPLR